MRRLTATLLCLGALSLAPIASAQQHDMSQHAMHADDDAIKVMFEKADANHDGSITFEEMKTAHAAMGMGMDKHMGKHADGHMQGHAMKDGKKMGCCCCDGDGEGGMKGCGMGDKADPVGEAMSGK